MERVEETNKGCWATLGGWAQNRPRSERQERKSCFWSRRRAGSRLKRPWLLRGCGRRRQSRGGAGGKCLRLFSSRLPTFPSSQQPEPTGAGGWSARGQGRPSAASSSPAQHRAARGGEWTEGAGVTGGRAAAHSREEEFGGAEGEPGRRGSRSAGRVFLPSVPGNVSFGEVIILYPGISSWTRNYMYRNFLELRTVVLMSPKYSSKGSPHKRGGVWFPRPGASPKPLGASLPASSGGGWESRGSIPPHPPRPTPAPLRAQECGLQGLWTSESL